MGIDVWEVVKAASTKPFGFMPFYPGSGLGGHCIPIDPFYLTWKSREYGVYTKFIELAGEVNTGMPNYVVSKVKEALNIEGKAVSGSKILVLGVAYKADVDDDRESPAFPIMRDLETMGAQVHYHDPYITKIGHKREYPEFTGRVSKEISEDYDLWLTLTAHSVFREIDYSNVLCPIVDTRNIVSNADKLYKA